MITAAFLTLAAVLALADILGPGHDFGAVGSAVVLFLFFRWLGPRGWNRLLRASLWLSVGIAAMAVGQVIINSGVRAWGPFNSPNYLGAYAVLMFFLSWLTRAGGGSEARKPGYTAPGLYAAANLLSLALSQSRGALLALGAGILIMLPKKSAVVISASLLTAAFLIRPGNEEVRLQIWWTGLQVAYAHPWLGWGQGGIGMLGYGGFYNIPLDLLIEAGILGVLAGAWLLVAAWRSAPVYRPFLTAWLVQGLFLFSVPATSILLVATLGYLSVRRGRGRQDVADGAGLIDGHDVFDAVGRRLERPGAEKLQLAVLGGGEAHPLEDVIVDVRDDAAGVDRAGDRRGYSHHAKRQRAAEKDAGEAGTDRGAGHHVLRG